MDIVLRVLPYALPPILGAVIGYVTNALAIRMLFRPLTEKRVFGIRVPLTPGIIPRQRHSLATSIGRMVSTKLLTEDILVARLHDEEFARTVSQSVGRFTDDILHGRVVQGTKVDGAVAVPGVARLIEQLLSAFFLSDAFAEVVHRLAESVARGALAVEAGAVVPDSSRIGAIVDGAIGALAGGPAATSAEEAVRRWAASHIDADTPLDQIIGLASVERLAATIPALYEPALDALLAFLRTEGTREQLSVHGRELLNRVLKRLNLFQRFIVSAGQYDRNLSENMPAVVDDVIASVERAGRSARNRGELIAAVQQQVHELGGTGIRSLLERFDLHAEMLVGRLFSLALELIGRPDVRSRIRESVETFVEKNRVKTLGELLATFFGVEAESLADRLVSVVDEWVAGAGNADRLASGIIEFVSRYAGRAEREGLAAIVPVESEQKAAIDAFLTERLLELVERRVPELIAGLDVYTMVVEKIDGLDMESVEELLLMVIARHLKWINLFGAMLGALIGGVQVLISVLT